MTTATPEIKEEIKAAIENYHQANFWQIFPAGNVPNWVHDAVAQYVQPLHDEIAKLKEQLSHV